MSTFYPTIEYNSEMDIGAQGVSAENKWGDRYNLDHVVSIMFDSGRYALVMDNGYKHTITPKDMAAINKLISSTAGNVDQAIGNLVDGLIGKLQVDEDGNVLDDRDTTGTLVGEMKNLKEGLIGQGGMTDKIQDALNAGLAPIRNMQEEIKNLREGLIGQGGMIDDIDQSLNNLTENLKTVLEDSLRPVADLKSELGNITAALDTINKTMQTVLNSMTNKLNSADDKSNAALSAANSARDQAAALDSRVTKLESYHQPSENEGG